MIYKDKNNFTKEEVIAILEHIKRGYVPDYNFLNTEDDVENYNMHMAMSIAIEEMRLK